MDKLFVVVLLRHHLLTAPLYLVELLPYAVQRQAVELTPQRSCGSSLSGSFVCLCLFCCQLALCLVPFMLGVFCPLSLCPRVSDDLVLNELQMQSLPWTLSVFLCPFVCLPE